MKKAYLYAGAAIFCWSTMAVISKILLGSFNNFQLLWSSSFFACVFLLITCILTGKLKILKDYKFKDFVIMSIIGVPGTFLYYVFYYTGADLMPASQAFIVNYLWPVMSVVFACIILKESITIRKIVAILISFIGVGIVTCSDSSGLDINILIGALACMLGAVSYGIFTALNQKYEYDKSISTMIAYLVTFVLTTIINLFNGGLFVPDGIQVLGIAWNGIICMAAGTTVWILALNNGNTAKISNLAYITPFLSLVWTSLILKEQITAFSVIGLIVIVIGILIQLKDK